MKKDTNYKRKYNKKAFSVVSVISSVAAVSLIIIAVLSGSRLLVMPINYQMI